MKQTTTSPTRSFVPLIASFTFIALAVIAFAYVALQQNYRQNANDPQIQIATDLSNTLSAGSMATDVVDPSTRQVDPRKTLSAFAIITDQDGTVLASNLKMDDTIPTPPKSVLRSASVSHQNRITWQPEKGTRIALVVQGYKHENATGYVLVGRSLREIEVREDTLFWMAASAAAFVVAISILTGGFYSRNRSRLASGRSSVQL